MKKIIFAILFLLGLSSSLNAKNYEIVFWYPGEAGSTAEAAPVLQDFFNYLNKKTGIHFQGKYFNSTSEGIDFIKKNRDLLGVVSWAALKENEKNLPPATTLAQALPLPHGSNKDQFVIVGTASQEIKKIYTSLPLSLSFIRSHLAPEIPETASVKKTATILKILKQLPQEPSSAAILTPMEKFSFDAMKGEWKKGLTTLYICKPIPTAPVVFFGQKPEITDQLISALLSMGRDKEAKEILEALRLKGFGRP